MKGKVAKHAPMVKAVQYEKIQVAGFVEDNDSQSVDAVQSFSDHIILKQYKISHTKNIKNMFYNIKNLKILDLKSE